MSTTKRKGSGAGGCCCGGCKQPPGVFVASAIVQEVQQYCCRCIPNQLCLTVTEGSYDSQTILISRSCNTEAPDIHYTTTISVDGVARVFNVRLLVIDEECYLGWDIPALDLSDTVLIDQNEAPTPYVCTQGMKQKRCVEFGGEWEVESPQMTITLVEPASIDLREAIQCGGCNCHCDCLCFSVYSRNAITGVFTLVGSNEVVCSEKTQDYISACGDPEFLQLPPLYQWTSNGWTITLGDRTDHWCNEYEIITGTEGDLSPCTGDDAGIYATAKGDGIDHTIAGAGAQVIYDCDLEYRTALSLKWVGRSYDEDSSITFEAWNWLTLAWVTIQTIDGRPITTDINRAFSVNLNSVYTGTGLDDGRVRIRLTLVDGDEMRTDMLRLITNDCCAWRLTPPNDVTLLQDPEVIQLTGANACPSPSAFWQMEAYDGTEWYVSAECNQCGGFCGSFVTGCCPRVIPNILFAEVTIDCPTCGDGTIVVPLTSDGTGAIWSGEATSCGNLLQVIFSCGGSDWNIQVNASVCTFSGSATSTSCDPLNVDFSGELGGGIGCCGAGGGGVSSAGIVVSVFE